MKARTAIITALTLVTLVAPAAEATTPGDDGGVAAPSKTIAKRLPLSHGGSCTTKPTRRPARLSTPANSAPYLVTAAAVRRNS
jgi:hypothetical protein